MLQGLYSSFMTYCIIVITDTIYDLHKKVKVIHIQLASNTGCGALPVYVSWVPLKEIAWDGFITKIIFC